MQHFYRLPLLFTWLSFALGFLVGITQTASANSARNAGYVYQTPSYNWTHADVELHYSIPYNSGFMAGWTTSKMFNSTPVSYTHLDVYKRQTLTSR